MSLKFINYLLIEYFVRVNIFSYKNEINVKYALKQIIQQII